MDIKQIIINNLIYLRKKNGLTQQEVADELNYSDKTVSKWERGESLPDAETLFKLANFFAVDVNYLYEVHEVEKISLLEEQKIISKDKRIKMIFALMLMGIIFVLIGILVASLSEVIPHLNQFRLYFFIVPAISLILWVINLILGRKKLNRILLSLFVWSFSIALYLSLYDYKLVIIFSIAVVVQVGISFFPQIDKVLEVIEKKRKNNSKK